MANAEWNPAVIAQAGNAAEQVLEPANIEEDSQIPRNPDGSLDGGVAVPPESNKSTAAACEMMLFLECVETIEGFENHPVLSLNTIVCIGLEKLTKLGAVFERYVEFVNEYSQINRHRRIQAQDLEYVHCAILRSSDTPEASAIMKNDRIRVRKSTRDEKASEADALFMQRESDKNYFESLRGLITDTTCSCDIILDCQGKLVDDNGLNQEVLRTTLRGHSAILSKRCRWLRQSIKNAQEEFGRRSVVSIPAVDHIKDHHVRSESDDGDDGIAALPYPAEALDESVIHGATEIENDEDEELRSSSTASISGSPLITYSCTADLLWVTIPNHPPEAVKLLMEYCYTNSIIPLGQEAFEVAWNANHDDDASSRTLPRQWTDARKRPRVSFATALAGIAIAEEASLPRMSLMCEIAACNLVESSSFVEALSMCTKQNQTSGNPLKHLRKAAMCVVLRQCDMEVLLRAPSFERALREPERSAVFVPSLLLGVMEAITDHEKGLDTATHLEHISRRTQERLDRDDILNREMERRKYRADLERLLNSSFKPHNDLEPPSHVFVKWDARPLKRGAHYSWGKRSRHDRKQRKGQRGDKIIGKKR